MQTRQAKKLGNNPGVYLEELLAAITRENVHCETDTGEMVGAELRRERKTLDQ